MIKDEVFTELFDLHKKKLAEEETLSIRWATLIGKVKDLKPILTTSYTVDGVRITAEGIIESEICASETDGSYYHRVEEAVEEILSRIKDDLIDQINEYK